MKKKTLQIAITVDPEIPVPPIHYGGIERIVDILVRELQKRGHQVYLFANKDSSVETHLIPYPGSVSQSLPDTFRNMLKLWAFTREMQVNIIHSFGRLAYLFPFMFSSIPKVQSYQRHISPKSIRLGNSLAGKSLVYTSCSYSNALTANYIGGQWATIYNCVETTKYSFRPQVPEDAPLVFLGRVERIKGAHTAIEVARRCGRRLIIAGNHAENGQEVVYFQNEILPHCDGRQISYVGPVTDAQKNELLGNAAAFLFPIEWEEPFGIVMVEAMACGTPIIGFRRGSVPEVIEHGQNGFICQNVDEMVNAITMLGRIDRHQCRQSAEKRFSGEVISGYYESLYYSLL